jgi:hypothetical protein
MNKNDAHVTEQVTHNLIEAIRPWLSEVIGQIRSHREQWDEVVKCMNGNGDVRIVFYARENVITIEAVDYADSTTAEVFRQHLVPPDAGFALPEGAKMQ